MGGDFAGIHSDDSSATFYAGLESHSTDPKHLGQCIENAVKGPLFE